MALDAALAPFADPDRLEVMLAGLNDLLAKRRASVRFSNHTGLVRSLRGELYPGQKAASAEEMLVISKEFLCQHGAALHGSEDGYRWRAESQPIMGSCARLRQTDQSGIPVYGATMVCGFNDDGQLSMVNSSCYPIPPEANYERSFKLTWEEAREMALKYVITHFLPEAQSQSKSPMETPSLAKEDWDLVVIPGDDLKEGRVIFPWFDEDKEVTENPYRAAWVTLVIDRAGSRSWEVIVDAENGQVLAADEATVEATIHAGVYRNNAKALAGETETRKLNGDVPSGKLANAPHFEMQGEDFAEPSPPPSNGFRSANVYYHLHHALETFVEIAENAWSAAPAVPRMPGEEGRVPVYMRPGEESGSYKHGDRSISFGRGQPSSHPPVDDPAHDCEVVYHEYTHAVLHVVQPDLFKKLPYLFKHAINEGGAFYFGCTLSERPHPGQPDTVGVSPQPYRWGEVAYGRSGWTDEGFRDLQREDLEKQEPEYDYLPVYGVFPRYEGGCKDPTKKKYYACGMLWARALWDIRRVLGHDIADAIILRGLSLTGGVQSELETPAEAIIHADGEYTRGGPPHESALRLIFCSRGIMADGPIHDLIEIELGGKTYVFAATENTARNNPRPGCMFSADKGGTWAPLGTDGPLEVVALAAVKVSQTKAVIWAAGEHRAENGDDVIPTAKVYRYDLEDGVSGGINTGDAWVELPDLIEKVNVLSLAATKKPGGAGNEFWLFAGTEKGLYKYDGSWQKGPGFLRNRPIFGLATREQPSRRLLVATQRGAYVLEPTATDVKRDSKYQYGWPPRATFLTMIADPEGEDHLWAGTAFAGIYHFVPSVGWEHDDTIKLPVYRLLVEKQGTEWVLYAGTNDGVYRRIGSGNWEKLFETSAPNAESIEGTSVATLCRAEDRLLAGTAQRGLWGRGPANGWMRLTEGLPRIGRLTDATADTCNWSHEFTNALPEHGAGTHVFYVPNGDCDSLSFTKYSGKVDLALHYVSPYTNTDQNLWAGPQHRKLTNGTMEGEVQQGFYLLTVMAGEQETSYRVAVQLT